MVRWQRGTLDRLCGLPLALNRANIPHPDLRVQLACRRNLKFFDPDHSGYAHVHAFFGTLPTSGRGCVSASDGVDRTVDSQLICAYADAAEIPYVDRTIAGAGGEDGRGEWVEEGLFYRATVAPQDGDAGLLPDVEDTHRLITGGGCHEGVIGSKRDVEHCVVVAG